jgi:hypothetical protein
MDNNLTDFWSAESTTSQLSLETEMLVNRCGILAAILSREKLSKEQRSKYIAEVVITGFMLGQRLTAQEMTEALFGWLGESAASTGINASLLPTTSQDLTFNSQFVPTMGQPNDCKASSDVSDEGLSNEDDHSKSNSGAA